MGSNKTNAYYVPFKLGLEIYGKADGTNPPDLTSIILVFPSDLCGGKVVSCYSIVLSIISSLSVISPVSSFRLKPRTRIMDTMETLSLLSPTEIRTQFSKLI